MNDVGPDRCTLTLIHYGQKVTLDVPYTDDAVELLRLATYALKAVGYQESAVQSAVPTLAAEFEPLGDA